MCLRQLALTCTPGDSPSATDMGELLRLSTPTLQELILTVTHSHRGSESTSSRYTDRFDLKYADKLRSVQLKH